MPLPTGRARAAGRLALFVSLSAATLLAAGFEPPGPPPPHPYLLFSAAELPALRERCAKDPRSHEIAEKLRLDGRRIMHAPTDSEPMPARNIHSRYGGGDDLARWHNRHLNAAYTLAFLYQLTGDVAYVPKAFEHADLVCGEESWVMGAHHYEVIYPRVWPEGARDDQVVFSFDLGVGMTAQKLALIYDWLYPALNRAQRDRLRGALLEKAITRVRGNYDYHWWATAYRCNWSGICHSSVGLAALALRHEDPALMDVIARSTEGLAAMLDHIGPDGGWQEGRSYWAYGIGESVPFIEALKRATKGKTNLFQHRALAQLTGDFALYGLTAGFGDGTSGPVGESAILHKLARESGDGTLAWYIENFVRPTEDIFELLWSPSGVKPTPPTDGSRAFESIGWAVLRRDFSPNSLTIATKAGPNDDPHHGHMDVGTFNLTWQNQTFIGEIARTPYDEQFFGALRWEYLQARSTGHNVVLVNGEEQICAKTKDQPWREGVGGTLSAYRSEPTWAAVAIDATKAYAGTSLQSWTRWLALEKERNIAIVVDRVRCAPGAEIDVRFHPGVDFEVAADHVMLRATRPALAPDTAAATARRGGRGATRERPIGGGETVQVGSSGRGTGMIMTPIFAGDFRIAATRQPDLPVMQDAQVTWVPCLSVLVTAPRQENVIATIFRPADATTAAFTLSAQTNAPTVSFIDGGERITYVFGPSIERSTQTSSNTP